MWEATLDVLAKKKCVFDIIALSPSCASYLLVQQILIVQPLERVQGKRKNATGASAEIAVSHFFQFWANYPFKVHSLQALLLS